jgi:hypothetical protein
MKRVIFVAAALFLFVSLPVCAEWSKPFEVEYVMGDGDNRSSARQAALEQIKLKASNEAGTYVQSTTTMHENGELTENIQMLSASLVKVLAADEKLTVNKAGQAVLRVKAVASLDESELVRRVAMVQQDKAKERQVKQLQSENEALRKDFEKIRNALATRSDQARTAELLAKQDATLKRMAENGKTMTLVFERGTLLQLASHNSDSFEKAKRDLDENFFAPLMQTPVTTSIESVEADGKNYVALVRVGWRIDTKPLHQVLARYLNADVSEGYIRILTYKNLGNRGPNVLSDRLYHYLSSKRIELQLQLAGGKVQIPVFYMDGSFFSDCSMTTDGQDNHLCLISHLASAPELIRTGNPVRIRLSREAAERATRVETSWIVNNLTLDNGKMSRQSENAK